MVEKCLNIKEVDNNQYENKMYNFQTRGSKIERKTTQTLSPQKQNEKK